MKIYFDVSCLNRPFDDQRQGRIRLESEAVTLLFDVIDARRWEQVSSRMAEIETRAIGDEIRRRRVLALLPEGRMELGPRTFERAKELIAMRFRAADAVHIAAAEQLHADVLLTCDDQFLKVGEQLADRLFVRIANPIDWMKEQFDAPNTG
jgi:predicted nucleic acid-binding protein